MNPKVFGVEMTPWEGKRFTVDVAGFCCTVMPSIRRWSPGEHWWAIETDAQVQLVRSGYVRSQGEAVDAIERELLDIRDAIDSAVKAAKGE